MPIPGRMKAIKHEYGKPGEELIDVITRVLNEERSIPKAANRLNISERNLWAWVDAHGLTKHIIWLKPDQELKVCL